MLFYRTIKKRQIYPGTACSGPRRHDTCLCGGYMGDFQVLLTVQHPYPCCVSSPHYFIFSQREWSPLHNVINNKASPSLFIVCVAFCCCSRCLVIVADRVAIRFLKAIIYKLLIEVYCTPMRFESFFQYLSHVVHPCLCYPSSHVSM